MQVQPGNTPPATPPTDLLFGNNPPAETPPATPPAAPATPPVTPPAASWKDQLDEDIKAHSSLEKITDVKSLARSFVNAQKILGADKVVVPPKGSPPEVMKEFYQKIGLPKEEEYKLELDPNTKIDPEFVDAFKKEAYKLNVLPEQAKQIADWFAKENDRAYQEQVTKYLDGVKAEQANLKKEWGEAYNEQLAKATAALKEFSPGDEAVKFFKESGLGQNPHFIKLLAKFGDTLKEDQIRGAGGGSGMVTPGQAQEKIKELMGKPNDPNSAYYNRNHADHAETRKKVSALFEMAYPGTAGQNDKK